MLGLIKRPKVVGEFIRKRRVAMGLSQRALGLLFSPPVTTQFISNVERGVTPLPPAHIPTLAQALSVAEVELTRLLEREFTMKLSGRLGRPGEEDGMAPTLSIEGTDFDFMTRLYGAYQKADLQTRQSFAELCQKLLRVPEGSSGEDA